MRRGRVGRVGQVGRVGLVGLVGRVGQVGRVGRVGLVGVLASLLLVAQAFPPSRALEAGALRRGSPKLQGSGSGSPAIAQAPNTNALPNFITVQAPIVALTHARVIDGTGAPARANRRW